MYLMNMKNIIQFFSILFFSWLLACGVAKKSTVSNPAPVQKPVEAISKKENVKTKADIEVEKVMPSKGSIKSAPSSTKTMKSPPPPPPPPPTPPPPPPPAQISSAIKKSAPAKTLPSDRQPASMEKSEPMPTATPPTPELLASAPPSIPKNYPRFPLPPPKASTTDNIPSSFFQNCLTIGDVDKKLSQALDKCGYLRKSYFYVPNGFALVTQFEAINKDGSPKQGTERWVASGAFKNNFSISEYFKRLLYAKKGYYRTIVFIFSEDYITQSSKEATSSEAKNWLETGANKLPKALVKMPFNQDYTLDALIYEFKKSENDSSAVLVTPSEISGRTHLIKTKIIQK